jgi:hypothetical protein
MGNIIGEGFDSKIIDQIKVRQKIYGSKNRTNEQLSYLNARTGWCKLVSSVDIENANDPNLRGIKVQPGANSYEFASQFVLFNGTSKNNITLDNDKNFVRSEIVQRSGVWPGNNETYNDYAYGVGGTSFGLRPMPGIIQATTKNENRGSLRTSEIVIKAHSKEQFDIIDLLYLRLGFTMLLEWGNSSYFDNSENYIKDNTYSLANDFLLGKIKYENFPQKIRDKILASNGNYDAVIGKVVNFSWNFDRDGTYNITLKLRSMGDVIESLTTNVVLPKKFSKKDHPLIYKNEETPKAYNPQDSSYAFTYTAPDEKDESQLFIKSQANVHSLGAYLFKQQQNIDDPVLVPLSRSDGSSTLPLNIPKYTGYDDTSTHVSFLKQEYEGGVAGNQYYIKLATLLGWIQENIIPYIDDPEVKMLKINNRVKDNIIYLQDRQLSTDPRVLIFKSQFNFKDGSGDTVTFAQKGDNFFVTEPEGLKYKYGYIMNSYFNMTYVLQKMQSLINSSTGKVALLDFLNSLAYGWNQSTGYFNELEFIVYDDVEIRIIDKTSVPEKESFLKNNNLAEFDVYGYYDIDSDTPHSGFIRDINFTTTVSPNLATMLTIGAQSNGYIVGQDATALSRMNSGLKDRFKPTIYASTAQKNQEYTAESLQEEYQEQINAFNTYLRELGSVNGSTPKWNTTAIDAWNSAARTFYEYDQASQTIGETKINKFAASPNNGFLPFDLSITMDGLSGMKIYQKFIIDTRYLPSNYPKSLEFIIKGISHSISGNEWVTQIESLAIPKNPYGSIPGKNAVEKATQTNKSKSTNPTTVGPTPNADRLRAILKSLGYREKGKQISDAGDITSGLVDYAASVFKEIKKQLPLVTVTVTGGNDKTHKSKSPNSSHTTGNGLDFTISPFTSPTSISNPTGNNRDVVDKILGGFAAGNQNKAVSFINEYDYPSKNSTAGHFHIRIGGIESNRIYTFIAQANKGKLKTYLITPTA